MNLEKRIEAFSLLGDILRAGINESEQMQSGPLHSLINSQIFVNPWFTPGNVRMALGSIAQELTSENLIRWTSYYPELSNHTEKKTIGVIMAGNIPLVGFHDFLSVLISGNRIIAKTSSKDSELLKFITGIICNKYPGFLNDIIFTEGILTGFDAIIATGSGNSSRYFDYYFGKFQNIIRRNRNSVAIIDGTETDAELTNLGIDIFSYFGLGCRNVSKLFVPYDYDFDRLIAQWSDYENIVNHNKYANNYDHNKALFLVNRDKFLDKGFILLKENSGLSSPVSVLYYEKYENIENVLQHIDLMQENIQCIVGHNNVPFGEAQFPELWNYADGIDTIEFMLKLKTGV